MLTSLIMRIGLSFTKYWKYIFVAIAMIFAYTSYQNWHTKKIEELEKLKKEYTLLIEEKKEKETYYKTIIENMNNNIIKIKSDFEIDKQNIAEKKYKEGKNDCEEYKKNNSINSADCFEYGF